MSHPRLRLAWLRLRALARCLTGSHPVALALARGDWAALDWLIDEVDRHG